MLDEKEDLKREWAKEADGLQQRIAQAFGRQYRQTGHHTRHMDYFLMRQLPALVEDSKPFHVEQNEFRIQFRWIRPRLARPYLLAPVQSRDEVRSALPGPARFPHDCRTMSRAYSAAVIVDVEMQVLERVEPGSMPATFKTLKKEIVSHGQQLFRMPILLGSCLDHVAQGWPGAMAFESPNCEGGFYVIASLQSTEKHIPLIESLAFNHNYLFPLKKSLQQQNQRQAQSSENNDEMEDAPPADDELDDAGAEDATSDDEKEKEKEDDEMTMMVRAKLAAMTVRHFLGGHRIEHRGIHESKRHRSPMTTHVRMPHYSRKYPHAQFLCDVKVQYMKPWIPATVLFLALGCSLEKMCALVGQFYGQAYHPEFDAALKMMLAYHPARVSSPDKARAYLAERVRKPGRVDYIDVKLCTDLFPNLGLKMDAHPAKAAHLAWLMWRLLCKCVGLIGYDDREFYGTQRFEDDASLMASLLRQSLTNLSKQAKYNLHARAVRVPGFEPTYYESMPPPPASAPTSGTTVATTTTKEKDARRVRWLGLAELVKKEVNWEEVLPEASTTGEVSRCMSNGIWSPDKRRAANNSMKPRENVTMMMYNGNIHQMLSLLRRVTTSIPERGKSSEPRQFQLTHTMRACCSETPEGEKCGTIRFLAASVHVAIGSSAHTLLSVLAPRLKPLKSFVCKDDEKNNKNKTLVVLNGSPVGWTDEPDAWVYQVQHLRRHGGRIDADTSVVWERSRWSSTLKLDTDTRRSMRPLVVASAWAKLFLEEKDWRGSWSELRQRGIVEFVDPTEERSLSIGYPSILKRLKTRKDAEEIPSRYTHLELDGAWMMGTSASTIPAPNHNQSPRNLYQCNMCKSAQCYGAHNPYKPMPQQNELDSAQRALVNTDFCDTFGLPQLDQGFNMIVAVLATDGNQEDEIVFSQEALDRGMGHSTCLHQHRSSQKSSESVAVVESFGPVHAEDTVGMRDLRYDKIGVHGMPECGDDVEAGTVVLGKSTKMERMSKNAPAKLDASVIEEYQHPKKHDESIALRPNEGGVVERTAHVSNNGDMSNSSVTVRSQRKVEMGDKFSSRHGQKGVNGMIVPAADMPFVEGTGDRIEAIITPLGFTSRMTMGQMVEMLEAMGVCFSGEIASAHPFRFDSTDQWARIMAACKGKGFGLVPIINGKTGERVTAFVFRAPVFFQKLNHMVSNKKHARGNGPKQALSRQPTDSKARDGGQRFGEMERNCLEDHGCAEALKERQQVSDSFKVSICDLCGLFGEPNWVEGRSYCRHCDRHDTCHTLMIPYSNKLLFQEIQALHVDVRLKLEARRPRPYRMPAKYPFGPSPSSAKREEKGPMALEQRNACLEAIARMSQELLKQKPATITTTTAMATASTDLLIKARLVAEAVIDKIDASPDAPIAIVVPPKRVAKLLSSSKSRKRSRKSDD